MAVEFVGGGSVATAAKAREAIKGLHAHVNSEGKVQYTKASEFSEDEAQQMIWDACRGLVHCRKKGMQLANLQPKNLLVDD